MALSPEQIAVLEARLEEAETVYHAWRLGKRARTYQDANGERVEYSVEGMRGIAAYIADLKRQLGTGCSAPMRPFYI